MRSRLVVLLAGLVLLGSGISGFGPARLGAGAAPVEILTGGNTTLLGTIPELNSVGGRIEVFDTSRGRIPVLVTNNHRGISTYDVSEPENPELLSTLVVPHFYNEDLEFGGNILITSTDPSWVDWGPSGTLGGIYLIDISDVENLTYHYENLATGNRWVGPAQAAESAGHTISCIRADCSWVYVNGTDEVVVGDLRDPANPVVAGVFASQVGWTHDIQVDETGIAWMVGEGGVVALDTTVPTAPVVVAGPSASNLNYHHNSLRPDAAQWTPRSSSDWSDPATRPGELLMLTEETAWPVIEQTACNGQGRFQTRRLRDRDAIGGGSAAEIDTLDTWETELQIAGVANTAVNWCSAHYFTEKNDLIAIAWYEQGVRILDVSDPRDIQQVGYFVHPGQDTWSTLWAGEAATLDGEVVYAFDQARGIDILLVGDGGLPVEAPILPEWTMPDVPVAPADADPQWGFGCKLPTAVGA